MVVKLKPSIKELDADIKQIDITKSGYRLIEVPNGMDVINYAQKLEKTNCYESVDYNTFCRVYFTLNDQYASSQDYLPLIDASRAWDITTGNPNIKVAIIDTGIKRDHEDLGYGSDSYTNVSYSLGYDYIENTSYHDPDDSHGTEVGGVAGAAANIKNLFIIFCRHFAYKSTNFFFVMTPVMKFF